MTTSRSLEVATPILAAPRCSTLGGHTGFTVRTLACVLLGIVYVLTILRGGGNATLVLGLFLCGINYSCYLLSGYAHRLHAFGYVGNLVNSVSV